MNYLLTSDESALNTDLILCPEEDPPELPVPLERLEARICELAGHLTAATCRFLELVADFDAREGWASWEMPSCAAWLSWKCQIAPGTAREHVRGARALPDLPLIRDGFAAARLSYAKVRALTRIATADNEEDLAQMAIAMTAGQLERFARAHRRVTDADGARARSRRQLRWGWVDDHEFSFRGQLPPEQAAVVLQALRAAMDDLEHPHDDDDDVSAETQLTFPETHPAWPGRCHLEDGDAISPATLQMIACNATISALLHDADGNVLNVGRRTRKLSAALRRAVRERDRHRCRYPGCESRRVDAHHIRFWSNGGETKLVNLISLCKAHHHLVHDKGIIIAATSGGFAFYLPDGAHLSNSPPLPAGRPDAVTECHGAEITPTTIVSPHSGGRLDLNMAVWVALTNADIRAKRRELAVQAA
jgi:hypothetical protein